MYSIFLYLFCHINIINIKWEVDHQPVVVQPVTNKNKKIKIKSSQHPSQHPLVNLHQKKTQILKVANTYYQKLMNKMNHHKTTILHTSS